MIQELAKRAWIPDSIRTAIDFQREQLLQPLKSTAILDRPTQDILWPSNLEFGAITKSLHAFAENQASSRELRERIASERGQNCNLNPMDFELLVYTEGGGYMRIPEKTSIFFDTEFGLALSHREHRTQLLGVGFDITSEPIRKRLVKRGIAKTDIIDDAVIIEELQGAQDSGDLFSGFRWEFVLLGLVYTWAQESGFQTLYLQPTANNQYKVIRDSIRGKLRYDVAGKRFGFTRQHPAAPFAMQLA